MYLINDAKYIGNKFSINRLQKCKCRPSKFTYPKISNFALGKPIPLRIYVQYQAVNNSNMICLRKIMVSHINTRHENAISDDIGCDSYKLSQIVQKKT